jgi:acyl-CoA synthetase (AMP-forming)/AMP-acid ligase II/acyl carrier protein
VALGVGGRLVVAGVEERFGGGLVGLLGRVGAVVVTVPPSLLGVLRPGDLDGVGTLVTAGERLEAGLAVGWGGRHRLLNAYGPTECTVCVSVGVVDGVVSVGGPMANVRVYVLGGALEPVPVGVVGELFVGGVGVARGYGGRAGLSAGWFVADRFAGDGSRMYRSGDRVRWLVDGRLEFVGRVDDQVKVRGFRVEPGEVEAVLAAHSGVRSAVVVAVGEEADRRLVAYVVPADQVEGMPAVGVLRGFVGGRLPEFMVPSVFVEVAVLPLTVSGKVDRAALPALGGGRPGLAGFVAPVGGVEELLAGVWAQVLGVDRVGARDDFFQLGGHSLLATQVISRIRDQFGVEIPLGTLFDQPTIAATAAAITRARFGVDGDAEEYEEFEL